MNTSVGIGDGCDRALRGALALRIFRLKRHLINVFFAHHTKETVELVPCKFLIFFAWSAAIGSLYNWSFPSKQLLPIGETGFTCPVKLFSTAKAAETKRIVWGGRSLCYLLKNLFASTRILCCLPLPLLLRQLQLHFWCVCIISERAACGTASQWSKPKKKTRARIRDPPKPLKQANCGFSKWFVRYFWSWWDFHSCDSSAASTEIRWPIQHSCSNWIRSCARWHVDDVDRHILRSMQSYLLWRHESFAKASLQPSFLQSQTGFD